MTYKDVKELNKLLPEPERNLIEALPELFADIYKKTTFQKEGRKEKLYSFSIKTIQKFPDWSDAEVVELVGVTEEFVQYVRRELAEKKQVWAMID